MNPTANLPPMPGHPEPHTMTWSALEAAAILEYGKACALAATSAPAAPSEPVGLAAMAAAFRTTQLIGGEKPAFQMVFQFPTMDAMHAADDEWRSYATRLHDLGGRTPEGDVLANLSGERGVPASCACGVATDIAEHAIEELHQLGYTVKGGQWYPPESGATQPSAKPFPAPGAWFPVDLLGNPMRAHAPGKWEVASWPSAKPAGAGEPFVFDSQFLSDVLTAAGLVSSGKRCKNLGERLGNAVMAIRSRATPPAAHAGPSDDPLWEAELLDTAREFGSCSYAIGGRLDYVRFRTERLIEFARAILASTPAPVKAGAPEAEVERLRAEQVAAVMPLIGPLLDSFEHARSVKEFRDDYPELHKQLRAVDNAMEGLTPPAAQGAPVEHGQLDPRTATEQARAMVRYCQSFNGQPWGGVDESVDRKNLAVAIDSLEETSAMLLNMAERVAAQGAPVMAEAQEARFLFIEMDDDKLAHVTYCADEKAVLRKVRGAVYSDFFVDALDDEQAAECRGIQETLLQDGIMVFEGDQPLHLFRLAAATLKGQAHE